MPTYKVKPNRKLTPQAMLDATDFTQYTDKDVVKSMRKGKGEVEIELFKVERYVSDNDLEKEYTKRNLIPADPYSLFSLPSTVLDEYKYIGTHWKNGSNEWCYATFYRWGGGREVYVDRYGDVWGDHWWFAGVRKSSDIASQPSSDTLPLELNINGEIYEGR